MIRFLGRGGMGEVYEAADLELHEHVALKIIRPEIAAGEGTLARFKREIQLARKVTHPNVCRVFDLSHHRDGNRQVAFLTMELLHGESLAARLHRQGRMTVDEALPIIEQIAAGLAAAHRAGVVHRDLKCGNVMLTPAGGDEADARAVITDFGLAHTADPGERIGAGLHTPGAFLGTPEYMAPEQLDGGKVTAAADIYALGLVMYEMVTGQLPFSGPTPLAAALLRLREKPVHPRAHTPELDPKFESAILRCLERWPEDRFPSALEAVAAIRTGSPAAAFAARWPRRWAIAKVAAVALLAVAGGTYIVRQQGELHPHRNRRSVAVIGFKNLARRTETDWLSTALGEMVAAELAAGERLRTVPSESVAHMKLELALADADSYSKETLGRIRRGLAADYVIVGSYVVQGQALRIDLRLQDAAQGETIAAVTETGSAADLLTLVSRTGARLRDRLGTGRVSEINAAAVRAATPIGLESQRLYAEGLAKLRVFDALAARELLEKAAAADPRHPLIHSALSSAWSALGYDAKAIQEGKKAFELAANLSREDRLWVEGLYREASRDWGKAIEIYRTLWNFFPDNPDYGLRLTSAQTSAGRAKEALETVAKLRRLPAPASDDPRIDLAQVSANETLSQFKQAQAGAARAAAKSSAQGARLLMARARLAESRAYLRMNNTDGMLRAAEDARRIYAEVGDRSGETNALTNIATVLSLRGDQERAKQMHREALSICRAIGNQQCIARNLNNLGIILKDQGDYPSAQKMQTEALAIRRETGDKLNEASTLNNLAVLLFEQSDLAGAKKVYQQALEVSREIGDKRGVVRALLNTALVLEQEADLAGAKKMHEESLAVRRQIGDRRSIPAALLGLGSVLLPMGDLAGARKMGEECLSLFREAGDKRGEGFAQTLLGSVLEKEGNLAEARKLYAEALATREKLGEKATIADSRLRLAHLDLEEGRPAEAFATAQSMIDELRKLKRSLLEAQAELVVSSALLAQGQYPAAERAALRAETISTRTRYGLPLIEAAVTRARIRAAAGNYPDAVKGLQAAITAAERHNCEEYRLGAALALGEVEARSGKPSGKSRLVAVEKEARAKGFGLIASKARSAASGLKR